MMMYLGFSRRTEGELAVPRRPRGSGLIELHCPGLKHSQSPPSINKAAASGKCVWWWERGTTHWSSFYFTPLKLSSTSGSLAEEAESSRKPHRRELHQNDLTRGTWNTGSDYNSGRNKSKFDAHLCCWGGAVCTRTPILLNALQTRLF